jgi:hypothetical protein
MGLLIVILNALKIINEVLCKNLYGFKQAAQNWYSTGSRA